MVHAQATLEQRAQPHDLGKEAVAAVEPLDCCLHEQVDCCLLTSSREVDAREALEGHLLTALLGEAEHDGGQQLLLLKQRHQQGPHALVLLGGPTAGSPRAGTALRPVCSGATALVQASFEPVRSSAVVAGFPSQHGVACVHGVSVHDLVQGAVREKQVVVQWDGAARRAQDVDCNGVEVRDK